MRLYSRCVRTIHLRDAKLETEYVSGTCMRCTPTSYALYSLVISAVSSVSIAPRGRVRFRLDLGATRARVHGFGPLSCSSLLAARLDRRTSGLPLLR